MSVALRRATLALWLLACGGERDASGTIGDHETTEARPSAAQNESAEDGDEDGDDAVDVAEEATAEPDEDPAVPMPDDPPPRLVHLEPVEDSQGDALAWRWFHRPPEHDGGGVLGDGALSDHAALTYVGDARRYLVRRVGSEVEVTREDRMRNDPPVQARWTRRYAIGASGDPVIGTLNAGHGDRIVVAAPTSRGYAISTLSPDDGAPGWQRTYEEGGPGPVQLGADQNGRFLAYLRGTRGLRVDELSTADGSPIRSATFSDVVSRTFAPPTQRPLVRGGPAIDGLRLVRQGPEGLALEARATDGRALHTVLTTQDPFDDRAVTATVGDVWVVVTFCAGASGAAAYGVSRTTGERVFTLSPGSIGSIGHSRYANAVRVVAEGGLAVVYGDESGGRYVGVIDVGERRLLGHEVWRL
ncbi:MAG: hypothetical protein AB7S26_41895 [Sandaracinaceae bacterium]